jgi:hypothetical protein
MVGRGIGDVEPGYYRYRRVRGGPWLPVRLIIEDGMVMAWEDGSPVAHGLTIAAVNDLMATAMMEGEAFTHPLLRLILFAKACSEEDYRFLVAERAWARANEEPGSDADRPVDMNTIPIRSIF